NISYSLRPWLEFKSNVGYNILRTNERKLTPSGFYDPETNPTGAQRSSYFNQGENRYLLAEPQLNAKASGNWGKLEALIGGSYQSRVRERMGYVASGFVSDELMDNPSAGSDFRVAGNSFSQYRYAALFGRVNYNLKDKYLINITGRRDGSSRFGDGRRFANFGAIGAAWVFSEEPLFTQKWDWISFGKIRVSYGITGNDQIGDYAYLDSYGPTG